MTAAARVPRRPRSAIAPDTAAGAEEMTARSGAAGSLEILMSSPLHTNDILTAPPVIAEIQYGIKRLKDFSKKVLLLKAERDHLLSIIRVLPWQPEASKKYGEIKANLEQRGELIDDFDIAIAAIAMSHKCGVLSANLKHFERIKDLEIKSWL